EQPNCLCKYGLGGWLTPVTANNSNNESSLDQFRRCQAEQQKACGGVLGWLGLGALVSGTPSVAKPFVTPGSFPQTSLLSSTLSRWLPWKLPFRVWAPTAANPLAKTNVVGRIFGRWVPVAAMATWEDTSVFNTCMAGQSGNAGQASSGSSTQ